MTHYVALATLTLQHRFFPKLRGRHLALEPDVSAAAVAASAGLIIKHFDEGLMVLADAQNTGALAMHLQDDATAPDLWFRVQATDTLLHQCTADLPGRAQSTSGESAWFFQTPGQPMNDELSVHSLARADHAGRDDIVALDNPQLARVVTTRDRLAPPLAFVRLALGDLVDARELEELASSDAAPRRFAIRLQARASRWRYIVCGAIDPTDCEVAETTNTSAAIDNNAIVFERRRDTLDSGLNVTSFLSDRAIDLRLRQPRRFALRDRSNGDVLIEPLPVAAADGLARAQIDGEEMYVSDIYIHS